MYELAEGRASDLLRNMPNPTPIHTKQQKTNHQDMKKGLENLKETDWSVGEGACLHAMIAYLHVLKNHSETSRDPILQELKALVPTKVKVKRKPTKASKKAEDSDDAEVPSKAKRKAEDSDDAEVPTKAKDSDDAEDSGDAENSLEGESKDSDDAEDSGEAAAATGSKPIDEPDATGRRGSKRKAFQALCELSDDAEVRTAKDSHDAEDSDDADAMINVTVKNDLLEALKYEFPDGCEKVREMQATLLARSVPPTAAELAEAGLDVNDALRHAVVIDDSDDDLEIELATGN